MPGVHELVLDDFAVTRPRITDTVFRPVFPGMDLPASMNRYPRTDEIRPELRFTGSAQRFMLTYTDPLY